MSRTASCIVAAALALTSVAAQAETPVFRWRTSLAGALPPPTSPGTPEAQPADPLAGPTTHLRVRVASFGEMSGALAEVAFTAGGRRVAPVSATVSDNSGSGDANAFDGDPATSWTGAAARSVATFTYEIPAGSSPDHLELVAVGGNAPASFSIDRSPNARSWIPVVSYSGETGWSAGEKRVYPFSTAPATNQPGLAAKFWRVSVDDWNDGFYTGVGEVVFRDASGADVTTGGKGSVVGFAPETASRVFDKENYPPWYNDWRSYDPAAFVYEFGQPTAVASFDVQSYASTGAPRRFTVESSDDGRRWTARGRYYGQAKWENMERRNFPVAFPTPGDGEHQFWRMAILKSRGGQQAAGANDFDVRAADGSSLTAKGYAFASSRRDASSEAYWVEDRVESNAWVASASDAEPWIAYALPKPMAAATIAVRANEWYAPQELAVEWSDDGETWARSSVHRGNGNWRYADERVFTVAPPPAAGPGEYRFWRVAVESMDDPGQVGTRIDELAFLDPSGSPLPKTGVATSDSVEQYTQATWAFDGLIEPYQYYWAAAKSPSWLAYEFPRPVKATALQMTSRYLRGPEAFRVEHSSDGSTWTTDLRSAGNGSWKADTRTFPFVRPSASPGEHQYWRILVSAVDDGRDYLGITELDFVAADGVDRQTQGSPRETAGSANRESYRGLAYAFDNDDGSEYGSKPLAQAGGRVGIGYAFPRPVPVNEVRIRGFGGGGAPRDFEIQWSDDGDAWTTVEAYANSARWTVGELRVFPIPKPKPKFEESHGYAINMRHVVPKDHAGTVSPMRIDSIRLLGANGRPVIFQGIPSVKYHLEDKTISNAFDEYTHNPWSNGEPEARIDIGLALPLRVTDFQATVTPGCTGCSVELILYRFIGDEATGTRDEVSKRTVR